MSSSGSVLCFLARGTTVAMEAEEGSESGV